MFYDQAGYDIRCEWGEGGIRGLAPISDVIVIVDVLSFSTAVDIATGRGAEVLPFAGPNDEAITFATEKRAILAGSRRGAPGYTLSPRSLLSIGRGEQLVLPSPNGATLTTLAARLSSTTVVLAGCLRNATAIARAAVQLGRHIAVIPAGERWPADHSLRPAIEDLAGAGAIIDQLSGTLSPEAEAAVAVYERARGHPVDFLSRCSSGRELIERGFAADVELAAEWDASHCVPRLSDQAFIDWRESNDLPARSLH